MMIRRLVWWASGLLFVILTLIGSVPAQAEDVDYNYDVRIEINSMRIPYDVPPLIKENRVLAPLRATFEALGASVLYDHATKEITVRHPRAEVRLRVGGSTALVNGQERPLDVPAMLFINRVLVPVRFIGEAIGVKVSWDGNSRTIDITGGSPAAVASVGHQDPFVYDYEPEDIELLARLISSEAPGQPYEGQVAVAAVVLNRVRDPRFPDTIREVIFQPGQFTVISNGQFYKRPVTAQAYEAAIDALRGRDPSRGALFFFNPRKTSNKFLWSREVTVEIGDHRFAK